VLTKKEGGMPTREEKEKPGGACCSPAKRLVETKVAEGVKRARRDGVPEKLFDEPVSKTQKGRKLICR
jgi:hypothetical protein